MMSAMDDHRQHVDNGVEVPALEFPDNDPAYIEVLRTTFQWQGIHDDTRAQMVTQLLGEDWE